MWPAPSVAFLREMLESCEKRRAAGMPGRGEACVHMPAMASFAAPPAEASGGSGGDVSTLAARFVHDSNICCQNLTEDAGCQRYSF